MRPLQENAATKRPTMRLRDPFSSYKCFEAIATPSPIAPISDGNNSAMNGNRNSTNLHRVASLDSLANSSEQDSLSDGGDADDIDKMSDVDSVTTYSQVDKSTTKAEIHRKSDLEDLKCEPIPKEPIIKAYLEKSHRKCDYKNCGYKKSDGSPENDSDLNTITSTNTVSVATNNGGCANSSSTGGSAGSSKTRKTSVTSSGSVGRMETIIEEPNEPKVSVKEILARFETMNSLEVC